MVKLEDLYTVYFLARANKRRSEDAVIFETNLEQRLCNLQLHINDRTYRANSNYTFVTMRPKPREVFACELESRIIQWYLVWRLTGIFERLLTDRTFNNRKDMGVDKAIRCVYEDIKEVSKNYTEDAWIVQWDIQGYFPSANCSIACQQIQGIIRMHYEGEDKEDLLWMAMISIHANPKNHCYRKSPPHLWEEIEKGKSLFEKPDGIGGAIGFLIWQTAMNIYLNDVDHWAVEEMELRYTRFVDDTVVVTNNKECMLAMLPLFRREYEKYGVKMHPKKFYCQHYSKGLKFLGAYIKYDRIYLQNRTLRNAKKTIMEWNNCRNKVKHIDDFVASVNSYMGLMKNRNEFKNLVRLHALIHKTWWKYLDMDWYRLCVVAKEKYKHKNINKFKLGF